MVLSQLTCDSTQVPDIDPVTMENPFKLSAAQWDFFQILKQADNICDIVVIFIVVLEFLAKRIQILQVFQLLVIPYL